LDYGIDVRRNTGRAAVGAGSNHDCASDTTDSNAIIAPQAIQVLSCVKPPGVEFFLAESDNPGEAIKENAKPLSTYLDCVIVSVQHVHWRSGDVVSL